MSSVQDRIAETLKRRGGKIQGKAQTREQRATSYFKVAERVVKATAKKPDLTGKPRSWKQVCDNERTVNVPQYTRTGTRTRNGQLTTVTIAAHCRNPTRQK